MRAGFPSSTISEVHGAGGRRPGEGRGATTVPEVEGGLSFLHHPPGSLGLGRFAGPISADQRKLAVHFWVLVPFCGNQPLNPPPLAGSKLRSEAWWFTCSAALESVFICVNLWLKKLPDFIRRLAQIFTDFFRREEQAFESASACRVEASERRCSWWFTCSAALESVFICVNLWLKQLPDFIRRFSQIFTDFFRREEQVFDSASACRVEASERRPAVPLWFNSEPSPRTPRGWMARNLT